MTLLCLFGRDFCKRTSPQACGEVEVYVDTLKHTCNDLISSQCQCLAQFRSNKISHRKCISCLVLTHKRRTWEAMIHLQSLWEEGDHLGRGHRKEQTPWPGCVWTGMKTSPTQWLVECVDVCWGSAWPPSQAGAVATDGGGTGPEHTREARAVDRTLLLVFGESVCLLAHGLSQQPGWGCSLMGKHRAQALVLLLRAQHRARWKNPIGIGVWAFLEVPGTQVGFGDL